MPEIVCNTSPIQYLHNWACCISFLLSPALSQLPRQLSERSMPDENWASICRDVPSRLVSRRSLSALYRRHWKERGPAPATRAGIARLVKQQAHERRDAPSPFRHCHRCLTRDRGKVFEEILKRRDSFQVVKEGLHRSPAADSAGPFVSPLQERNEACLSRLISCVISRICLPVKRSVRLSSTYT